MQHDWYMYHLRSTYKNRLDSPFNNDQMLSILVLTSTVKRAFHMQNIILFTYIKRYFTHTVFLSMALLSLDSVENLPIVM